LAVLSGNVRASGRWVAWLAILAGATTILLLSRTEIDQSHAALTLLLVVLGGSAGGGRPLGYALAILSFLIIDYYFQPPYNLIAVDKALDWVVLLAFLASAFVATELLTRARNEAETARERTAEVESLSRLGSETLRYARPEEALSAVVELIRTTLVADHTSIRLWDGGLGLNAVAAASSGTLPNDWDDTATEEVVAGARVGVDEAVTIIDEGRLVRGPLHRISPLSRVHSLALPLLVEARIVGVLSVSAKPKTSLDLGGARQRFLAAISYYAALGAERVRLASEAKHARELREANRAKDEVLASVSHDLRTPLTTIKLMAQSAAARGEPTAHAIEEQADRLAQLVTNVLDLSRIRAGGVSLDIELNTAEDLIGAAINRSEGIVRDRRIVTQVDLNEPALAGQFDFVQSLRIVGNLLDNALRYSPPGGVVELATFRDGLSLAIRVSDRGPGVPLAERDRIFEPFYRPRSEAPDAGHAGLGLSIAKRLAELQGGTLDYTARDEGGSVFTLRLPAAEWTLPPMSERDGAAEPT
jgi:two-component system sensor histidine kinase KdpD